MIGLSNFSYSFVPMSAVIANELGSREAAIKLLRNNVSLYLSYALFEAYIKCKNSCLGSGHC